MDWGCIMLGKGQNHIKVCLQPCELFSLFYKVLAWVFLIAFLNGRWCHGEGKLTFSEKATKLKRIKRCLRRESKQASMLGEHGQTPATPCHSQEGVSSHGCWVASVQQGRRGEEREKENFRRVWHLAERMAILYARQEDVVHLHLLSRCICIF